MTQQKLTQSVFNYRLMMFALSIRDSECKCDDMPHYSDCIWFKSMREMETLVSSNPEMVLKLLHVYDWADKIHGVLQRDFRG